MTARPSGCPRAAGARASGLAFPDRGRMNANDIQRQNEERFALAREQLRRADRLQASLALQAALLLVAAAVLLIAAGFLALVAAHGGCRVASPICLGAAALAIVAAAAAAMGGLTRSHHAHPPAGASRGPLPGIFFDLLGTADAFATPAEFAPAFRSALHEEMIGYALAELLQAGQAARRQRSATRWAARLLLLGLVLLLAALILMLVGA